MLKLTLMNYVLQWGYNNIKYRDQGQLDLKKKYKIRLLGYLFSMHKHVMN